MTFDDAPTFLVAPETPGPATGPLLFAAKFLTLLLALSTTAVGGKKVFDATRETFKQPVCKLSLQEFEQEIAAGRHINYDGHRVEWVVIFDELKQGDAFFRMRNGDYQCSFARLTRCVPDEVFRGKPIRLSGTIIANRWGIMLKDATLWEHVKPTEEPKQGP